MDMAQAYGRALRMERIGNYAAAIEVWRDVLSADPMLGNAHAALSRVLLASKRVSGAEAEARTALSLDAESIDAMLTLVTIAFIRDRRKQGFVQLQRLQEAAPGLVEAHVLKAHVHRVHGNLDKAAEAIAEALMLDPAHRAALIERGQLARVCGDYATVEQVGRTILARDPAHASALVLIGFARLDQGSRAEALDAAIAALGEEPDNQEALELIAAIHVVRNPLMGGYWHLLRLLARLSDTCRWLLVSVLYLGYLMTLTTMHWFAVPDPLLWLFVALYLAVGLGLMATRQIIAWQVARQAREVRLKPF